MARNNKYASPFDKQGRIVGIVLTILIHATLLFVGAGVGLKYIYPPPAEQGILLEFIPEEEPKPIQVKTGVEPRAKKADPEKEIRLVQKSEAANVGVKENHSAEATMGQEGDVPVPEPPRPKPINRKALFSSAKNSKQDTLAPQSADKVSDALKAGHPEGNTAYGNTDGTPTARLQGRTVEGYLPVPEYNVEKAGKVVVEIRVDQYGKVTNAIPGYKGTTVQDKTLWEAARKAALDAKFNNSQSAPTIQSGTITYIFKLR